MNQQKVSYKVILLAKILGLISRKCIYRSTARKILGARSSNGFGLTIDGSKMRRKMRKTKAITSYCRRRCNKWDISCSVTKDILKHIIYCE
mmetsp:Transcript_4623/g.6797  ORF Transcript_4623/g.6797 Transcript_4623/m.6797 type:complete len:91 (+) Transcript_4623:1646-1918(+)